MAAIGVVPPTGIASISYQPPPAPCHGLKPEEQGVGAAGEATAAAGAAARGGGILAGGLQAHTPRLSLTNAQAAAAVRQQPERYLAARRRRHAAWGGWA